LINIISLFKLYCILYITFLRTPRNDGKRLKTVATSTLSLKAQLAHISNCDLFFQEKQSPSATVKRRPFALKAPKSKDFAACTGLNTVLI
jgi:hypothetical protein